MSRASGAGAYSHGIAWPSPRPQLDGAPPFDETRLEVVSVAMLAIMSLGPDGASRTPEREIRTGLAVTTGRDDTAGTCHILPTCVSASSSPACFWPGSSPVAACSARPRLRRWRPL